MSESPDISPTDLDAVRWRVGALTLSGDYQTDPLLVGQDALVLCKEVERLREVVRHVGEYTGMLWYGNDLREGSQSQAIVRRIRGIVGGVRDLVP